MRQNMVTADALKSFIVIGCGFGILALYMRGKMKMPIAIGAIVLLCVVEMWGVNKRYLHDDMFKPRSMQMQKEFAKTPTDEAILRKQSLGYRVLNFASNTFNENNTSYYHRSIGGYHAAKLRRYQEMIEHYIAPQLQEAYSEVATNQGNMDSVDAAKFRVLNMLNTRYFIVPINQQGQTIPVMNPYAYGTAWFVDNVEYVANANQEIDRIGQVDPYYTAVVDNRYKAMLKDVTICQQPEGESTIEMKSYTPNHLTYEVNAAKDGVVVFSEIYYPDWEATIDGKPADVACADYILRAMYVPAGKHTIEMKFDPASVHTTETIAYIGYCLLLIGVVWYGVSYFRKRKQVK